MADLNGDGIPDLIVANSGSNDVLVFLGNADGTFQPAQSFFAGDNPVGITVAYLKGQNAPPDLVIANEGSNDVSILYGSGTGSNWTMTYGPRLQTGGIGPVSTVVTFLNGPNNPPDILASNSVSNDVGLIPGVGQGFFNDTNPTLFTTGSRPGQIVAVTTATGPGFVVLNTGSSTLTELSGFNGTQFTTVRTINAGGLNPVAVVAVNLDIPGVTAGLTDLIVADANTDDQFNPATGADTGNLALLVGDDTGFDDAETFTDPGMPNPSAVALSAVDGNDVFYATTDGVEHAFRFQINLGAETPGGSTPPPVSTLQPVEGASPVAFAPAVVPGNYIEIVSDQSAAATILDTPAPPSGEGSPLNALNTDASPDRARHRRGRHRPEQRRLAAPPRRPGRSPRNLGRRTGPGVRRCLGRLPRHASGSRSGGGGPGRATPVRRSAWTTWSLPDIQWRRSAIRCGRSARAPSRRPGPPRLCRRWATATWPPCRKRSSPGCRPSRHRWPAEGLPVLEGASPTWQGIGDLLPTVEASDLPLQDTVDAVSRSLLGAIGVSPTPQRRTAATQTGAASGVLRRGRPIRAVGGPRG